MTLTSATDQCRCCGRYDSARVRSVDGRVLRLCSECDPLTDLAVDSGVDPDTIVVLTHDLAREAEQLSEQVSDTRRSSLLTSISDRLRGSAEHLNAYLCQLPSSDSRGTELSGRSERP